jgi:hypothetical protein
MDEFITLILQLFRQNNYQQVSFQGENNILFFRHNLYEDNWLVAQGIDVYDKQLETYEKFLEQFKTVYPTAEKNISLLLLIDNDMVQENIDEVEIENDPLYFKKYVLRYDENGLSSLKSRIDSSVGKSFGDLIMRDETFDAMKSGDSGATLLYSIVHKLPFIPIKVQGKQMRNNNLNIFSSSQLVNLFDKIIDLDSDGYDSFVENYVNADNNEEHED